MDKLHTNTRDSAEGVEHEPEDKEREPAIELIGDVKGVDPSFVSPR